MVKCFDKEENNINLDQYDHSKYKLHASIQWLCGFIPSYHKDAVKNNVRQNIDFLPLPPKTIAGNAVWRDIVALLVSCEAYRCASFAIFGPPAPTNHWQVIQTLSRHGFYAVTEDGSGVVHNSLITANPFNQGSHLAVIDCLMQGYACKLVTIPRVVAVVRNIGTFNASQELPFDLEDSLVLWINKVCRKVSVDMKHALETKKGNLKLGLVHPSSTPLPPTIPQIVDLIQDIGDGQCLGVLVHRHLPEDLPLSALKFGSTLSQSEKAANLAALRFAIMTGLGASWFPLSLEMLLNPSFTTKANVIAFISELFWRFEVKGSGRNKMSSDLWMKEEEKEGLESDETRDMNCAAAATEIAQHLTKYPVSLIPQIGHVPNEVVDAPPPSEMSPPSAATAVQSIPPHGNEADGSLSQIDIQYLKSSTGRTPEPSPNITMTTTPAVSRASADKTPALRPPTIPYTDPVSTDCNVPLSGRQSGEVVESQPVSSYSPESRLIKSPKTRSSLTTLQRAPTSPLGRGTPSPVTKSSASPVTKTPGSPPGKTPGSPTVRASASFTKGSGSPVAKGPGSPVAKGPGSPVQRLKRSSRPEALASSFRAPSPFQPARASLDPPVRSSVPAPHTGPQVIRAPHIGPPPPESASRESLSTVSGKNPTPDPLESIPDSESSTDEVTRKYFRDRKSSDDVSSVSSSSCPEPSSGNHTDSDESDEEKETKENGHSKIKPDGGSDKKVISIGGGEAPRKVSVTGEDMVEEMRRSEEKKRDFYTNIAKWVESVNEEAEMEAVDSSGDLTDHLNRTIDSHFSKTVIDSRLGSGVGASYTISKEDKEAAKERGLPVIPVTPAPADPDRIKEDYMLTIQERDDAIRKAQEEEERKKREELEKKRAMEEKLAEERRLLEEMSDSSKGKKGKKGGKKGADKEGKSFPRRPASAGSGKGKAGAKGKKGQIKDDMSVKSEKISRSKSVTGKGDGATPKRRVKSARRAGKSVSFLDETVTAPVVPVIDLVPKEEVIPDGVCPFKKDTRVIGEDRQSKEKLAYFVPLNDSGLGVGAGPVLQDKPVLNIPEWQGDGQSGSEDSLQAMRNSESASDSESAAEEEEEEEDDEEVLDENEGAGVSNNESSPEENFKHILASLSPSNRETVVRYESLKESRTPSTPPPADSKQLLLRLHMMEKRKNIENNRKDSSKKWEEERSLLNQHVFYKALKKSHDVAQQATPAEIESELEQTDSLDQLIPVARHYLYNTNVHKQCWDKIEKVTVEAAETQRRESDADSSQLGTPPSITSPTTGSFPPKSPPKTPESDAEWIMKPEREAGLSEGVTPLRVSASSRGNSCRGSREGQDSQLIAVFNDYEELLTTSPPSSSPGGQRSVTRKPTAMQYFYGLEETEPDDKISLKRQQFFVAQKKKQEEIRARKELEQQRKLQLIRNQGQHPDLPPEGNLVTRCPRPKSSRIRVVKVGEQRAVSAAPAVMSCRTPNYEDDNRVMRPIRTSGGMTYRKVQEPEEVEGSKQRSPPALNKIPPSPSSKKRQVTATKQRGNTATATVKNAEKIKSSPIRPPALPLFVAPSVKSNAKVICNAVCWTCLSGVPDKPQQKLALQAIADNPAQQYVILFRDHIAKKFRAIYACDSANEKMSRIFGKGPKTVQHNMLSHLYKYETGSRSFSDLLTMTFSLSVDAITIKNELWRRAGVNPC